MSNEFKSLNVDEMPWVEKPNEKAGKSHFSKSLIVDDETGVKVSIVKYPAGFINPNHNHPCAHGMYVLKGILRTSRGDFGQGSFVWFPEGETMWHGATEDQDVEVVFITNKQFEMNYL